MRIRLLIEAGDRATRPLRSIAGGGREAADALKTTRDRLKALDAEARSLDGFRRAGQALRDTRQQADQTRAKVEALGREISATAEPPKKLTREFEKARRELHQLEAAEGKQRTELQRCRAELRAAAPDVGNLTQHQRDLARRTDEANRELSEQTRRVHQLDDRARRMSTARGNFDRNMNRATGLAASGAAGIGTAAAVGAPILQSVKAAQDFQSRMTDIAQKANLSRADAEKMGAGILLAAKAANQLPTALQDGIDTLAGFGMDPRQAAEMMRPIGRAATAYKAEIADLSAAAFAANDNLKVPVAQTGRMIDAMAAAGKAGAFEMRDMAQYFPQFTAAYQGLGQTGARAGADLAAAAQITRKGAGDSATAATNLANVLQKINAPATVRAFEKMGVNLPAALKRMYQEGKTPIEAIAELTNKTLKGDLSRIGYLFEDAQVQQGLRPLIQNMGEYRRIRAEAIAAAQANNTTDGDFDERMNDSGEATKQLAVRAQVLAIALGSKLIPAMDIAARYGSAFADWIGDIATRYPNATKGVMIGVAGFAALFAVLGGGAIVMAGLLAPFAALSFAAGALGIGLLPVIGIALGIVAAIGLVAVAFANWGTIVARWNGLNANVRADIAAVRGAVGAFVGYVVDRWNALNARVGANIGALRGYLASLPGMFVQLGSDMIGGLIRGILGNLAALKKTIVGAASAAADWFKQRLGIRSPSRVFMGFGGHIVDGLTNGIAAQESDPVRRMTALSRRLSAAIVTTGAAPALAMGAGGASPRGAGGSAPAAVHYHTWHVVQKDGQSAEDLARTIADEFDRRGREQAAALRSSLSDLDEWGS